MYCSDIFSLPEKAFDDIKYVVIDDAMINTDKILKRSFSLKLKLLNIIIPYARFSKLNPLLNNLILIVNPIILVCNRCVEY